MIISLLSLVGGLGIFLFGMKTMSDGIHNTAGERFHKFLKVMTGNPFSAILTGLLTTSVIQSSSATTVMLVSLVNANLVTLKGSIGVIMGANIGTTLTAWIVSFLGFKVKIAAFALPAIAFSLPFYFSRKGYHKEIGHILFGFGLLFLGLGEMKHSVDGLKDATEVFRFIESFSSMGYLSYLVFVLFGTLLTIAVQSSSAAMAITLTFAFNGWITFPAAAAIVLGENIGTTITAYLASLQMSVTAKRTARAHMVFNLIGVVWMLIFFIPSLRLIDKVIPGEVTNPEALPIHLSAFHTFFNITNTLLLVWFIPLIEKLVKKMIKELPVKPGTGAYKIPFVKSSVTDSVEINLISGRHEVGKMSALVHEMMQKVRKADPENREALAKLASEISRNEDYTDQMAEELSQFFSECSSMAMTEHQALQVSTLIRIVNELESVADSCDRIVSLQLRRLKKGYELHNHALAEIEEYADDVMDFLGLSTDLLEDKKEVAEVYQKAVDREIKIDKAKKSLTKRARNKIETGGDLRGELLFMEIIRHYEQIGDYCLNIIQALKRPESSSV